MIKEKVKGFAEDFENEIDRLFLKNDTEYSLIIDAMKYSVSDGGKRLRPFLVEEFYNICGGISGGALNFELAMEFIHTYSLIHDDLPCMDNDDFRRGKPSCHKKFGEEYALLAGDGLLTLAFEIAAKSDNIPAERIVKAINEMALLSGVHGMIGGQTVDLINEDNKEADINTVSLICRLKTGALIKAACRIGCILAGADSEKLKAATEYAENLGLAFQITDDILDITGDEQKLGKPIHSDEQNNKVTFVSLLGIEECKKRVIELTEKAKKSLYVFESDADDLKELADYLCNRDY